MPGCKHRAPRRVVAWGTSVLASALVAGLALRTDLDVEQIEATLPAALAALRRKRAHAVVCDQASVPAATILTLLELHPHLVIVIIDPNADQALTLRGRRPPMRTTDDLVTALLHGACECDDQVPTPAEVPT